MSELSSDTKKDLGWLLEEKYGGSVTDDSRAAYEADAARLAKDEPVAYVIGWQPFLGNRIYLDSKPLIPRPETEWWTEELIKHLAERFGDAPFTLLDLCAGSGAIGCAIGAAFPAARVSFGELDPAHEPTIRKNWHAVMNDLVGRSLADIRIGDLFAPFKNERFDIIATNPPYIPAARVLDESVALHEPSEALYAGEDGLSIIRRIAQEASDHLALDGELWMECDSENAVAAQQRAVEMGAREALIIQDQYDRPRLITASY